MPHGYRERKIRSQGVRVSTARSARLHRAPLRAPIRGPNCRAIKVPTGNRGKGVEIKYPRTLGTLEP